MKKDDTVFNRSVTPEYTKQVFKNGSIIEIVNFLENEYQNISLFDLNDKTYEELEKELLDRDIDLINKYLVRYCKTEYIYFYLLERDNQLIHQAIFNLNMIPYYRKNFVRLLISEQESFTYFSTSLIEIFFRFYIDNYLRTTFFSRPESSHKLSYLDALLERKDTFEALSRKEHTELLQSILTEPKIVNILQKESVDHDNWMTNKTNIQKNTWNLICNMEVNIDSIRLLSWMSDNFHKNINSSFTKDSKEIEKQLARWSNYDYKKPVDDYDYYSDGDDYNDKTRIQMIIFSFYNSGEDQKFLEYDGVRAYNYQFTGWWSIVDLHDDPIEEYKKFLETYGKREDGEYKDRSFKYFKLNEMNYTEKYFKHFKYHCKYDNELVIKNFEKIGSGILELSMWGMERLFDDNNLSDEKRQYYLKLYNKEKDKNELINRMDKLSNEDNYNKLLEKITALENKKDLHSHLGVYVLLIIILIYLIL